MTYGHDVTAKGRTVLIIVVVAFVILMTVLSGVLQKRVDNADIAIPHGYHRIYDEDDKAIICPKEYHFEYDKKGDFVLKK